MSQDAMASIAPNTQEGLRDKILSDIAKDVDDFLSNAKTVLWNSDGAVHTTFTTTVAIKKKVSADETTTTMTISSRERIPKPVFKYELDLQKGKQLVLL